MVKIEAAHARIFKRIFICKNCNAKTRADPRKVAEGKLRCRKCKGSVFRPKSKKLVK
jgi:ribosomal protein L40E